MVGKDIRAQVFHSIQVKVLATFLLILLPVYVLGAVIFHWTYLQMHADGSAQSVRRDH